MNSTYPHFLYLGSKSVSRAMLLREAQIPFIVVDQHAEETLCDWSLPLTRLVQQITRFKMEHVLLDDGKEGDIRFVVTADTLSQDANGTVQGKPLDEQDAIAKIKAARAGSNLATAFCLDRKVWKNGSWNIDERIESVVQAEYLFDVPDEWIPVYFEHSLGLKTSGAIAIEGFGTQFVKYINGSYSAIIGLPMFELRQALESLGFFDHKLVNK